MNLKAVAPATVRRPAPLSNGLECQAARIITLSALQYQRLPLPAAPDAAPLLHFN
jgi:hypothetical protein